MLEIKDCDICYMYIHDCKCGISTDISFLLFTLCIIEEEALFWHWLLFMDEN